jgi:two-component system chemotaxis response regulator CheY
MSTILIVEPTLVEQAMLTFVLHQASYTVFAATDGCEATAILEHEAVDVVITELHLPGIDGLSLLQHIRAEVNRPRIPVLILTHNARADMRRRAISLGASGVLNKPVSSTDLLQTVHWLLPRRRQPALPNYELHVPTTIHSVSYER